MSILEFAVCAPACFGVGYLLGIFSAAEGARRSALRIAVRVVDNHRAGKWTDNAP